MLLGKVESGKLECQPALIDLRAFCGRIIGTTFNVRLAAQAGSDSNSTPNDGTR